MEGTSTAGHAQQAAEEAAVVDPFTTLPLALALQGLARVPVDTRLRCAEVCPGWRAMVAERSLWTRLDLSAATRRVTPALLRAAAAKAGGALTALDVSGVWQLLNADDALREALREVMAANAGALRELRCLRDERQRPQFMALPVLEALMRAAPQLRVCEADVMLDDAAEAGRVLRNEGVFGPLRVHAACISLARAAAHAPLFADMAAHASLTELHPYGVLFDVHAALSLPRLRTVKLCYCYLSPASAPALARLLGSGTLAELSINNDGHALGYHRHADAQLLDAPAAALLGDALRANATLTSLTLRGALLWRNHAAAGVLLGALTGYASLRITYDANRLMLVDDQRNAGALLAALLAADAPALTALQVHDSKLGDPGLRPLFKALSRNSHLRTFDC